MMKHLAHGCITTSKDEGMPGRLLRIYSEFGAVLDEWKPILAGMETLYFGQNATSGMPVAEARGVLTLALAVRGIELLEFRPIALKQQVTGMGRASKEQVQEMVRMLLGLNEIPRPDHAADALAAALAASVASGQSCAAARARQEV
jgi:crossover junction endodeoxyribonuclease RuvC